VPATLFSRFIATVIDGFVLLLIAIPLGIAFGGGATTTQPGGAYTASVNFSGRAVVAWLVIVIAYYTVFEGLSGMTPGKRLQGLIVVSVDGTAIDWRKAALRNLLRIIDGIFFYAVGALVAERSETRQRLGDRVAGTVVVNRAQYEAFRLSEALEQAPRPIA
jgi:uncharacterized RDD family membrane protein YckC